MVQGIVGVDVGGAVDFDGGQANDFDVVHAHHGFKDLHIGRFQGGAEGADVAGGGEITVADSLEADFTIGPKRFEDGQAEVEADLVDWGDVGRIVADADEDVVACVMAFAVCPLFEAVKEADIDFQIGAKMADECDRDGVELLDGDSRKLVAGGQFVEQGANGRAAVTERTAEGVTVLSG
jgi:hypothetical protein